MRVSILIISVILFFSCNNNEEESSSFEKDYKLRQLDYKKVKEEMHFDFYCTEDCDGSGIDFEGELFKYYLNKDHLILSKHITEDTISIEFLIVASCDQEFNGDFEINQDTLMLRYDNINLNSEISFCICKYHYRIDIKNSGVIINAIIINDKLAFDTVREELIIESFEKGQETKLFKRNLPFEIFTLNKSANYPSSETDTSYCKDWILTKKEIEKIIKESEPISGYDWGQLFGHLACMYEGKIRQNENYYNFEVNSGGWFVIFEAGTSYTFGNFKKANDKYFISGAFDNEELINSK